MTQGPQRWGRVEEVFNLALDQTPESREQWLSQTCAGDPELRAEVSSLLKSDSAAREGFVAAHIESAFRNLVEDEMPKRALDGRRIGPWRLVRELGRGGMGAVYLAERADQQYESRVALKLVRPGLDTDFILSRFRRERQILARLEHPNITHLLDGGATEEGIPYLVMEYVEGAWITRYAADHGLSTEDRIRLCLPICSAVDYAHRNFIVHRDLKPANILIDRNGVPKLLDFGISKLLQADPLELLNTQGFALLTPEYASPEQILGEPITIASDVYSLGAVLYELLTGVRAHHIEHGTPLEMQRAFCEEPATLPSKAATDQTIARRLKGDLDNILLRAMQKEPARRYLSIEHFSEDLRRYLEHRPVLARPDSPFYRASKFIRRNRVVVTLAALAASAIIAGTAISLREARIANERFQDVRKLATTFVFNVEEAARDLPGSMPVRRLITQTGLEYLNNLARVSAGDWALKRELAGAYLRIGRVQGSTTFSNLGDPAGAMRSFTSAGRLLDDVVRHSPSDRQAIGDRMSVYYEISSLQMVSAQPGDMGLAAKAGLQLAQSLLKANPNDLDAADFAGQFLTELSHVDEMRGNWNAALSQENTALPLAQRSADANPNNRDAQNRLAQVFEQIGSVQALLNRPDEALANIRRSIALSEAVALRLPNDTIVRHALMHSYARLAGILGRPEYQNAGGRQAALEAGRKMVAEAQYLYDADSTDVRAMSDYGICLLQLGLITPAGPAQRQTFDLSEETLSRALARNPLDRDIVRFKSQLDSELAVLNLKAGRRAEGMHYYELAIAPAEKNLGPNPTDFSTLRGLVVGVRGLAEEQARGGAREEALSTLDRALRITKGVDANALTTAFPLRINVTRSWQAAGSVYSTLSNREHGDQAIHDKDAARMWYQRALDSWHKLESNPGFTPAQRHEMESAAQALAPGGLKQTAPGLLPR